MAGQSCVFCKGPSECQNRKLSCCRRCAVSTLLPLLAEIIGPDELRRLLDQASDAAADAGAGNGGGTDKLARLIAGARPGAAGGRLIAASVRRPIAFSFADIIGQPAPDTALQRRAAAV